MTANILPAMMLPYTFSDDTLSGIAQESEASADFAPSAAKRTTGEFHVISSKITVPEVDDLVGRERITDFLRRSAVQFRANLLSGRSQTGKTYGAIDLARRYKRVAWFSVDSADADWRIFARYLAAAVAPTANLQITSELQMPAFLEDLFAAAAKRLKKKDEMLIVIDDIHHVFDTPWFADFFSLFLSSAKPNTHLLLLCRSKPPLPLWRMRSKQVLNVVEERMLAFDLDEAAGLAKQMGLPGQLSRLVPASAYGRAGKVSDFLRYASKTYFGDDAHESVSPLLLANTDPFVP